MSVDSRDQALYDDLKSEVGEEHWPAFLQFVTSGTADPVFLKALDDNDTLKAALDKAYRKQVDTIAGFAAALRTEQDMRPSAPRRKLSPWHAGPWLRGGLAAAVVVAFVAGTEVFRLQQQNVDLKKDFDQASTQTRAELGNVRNDYDSRLARADRRAALAQVRLLQGMSTSVVVNAETQAGAFTLDDAVRNEVLQQTIPLLKDQDTDVKTMAYRAVVKIAADLGKSGTNLVPSLTAGLDDPGPPIRREAAVALSELGATARPALPALFKGLHDKDQRVARSCADAVGRIAAAAEDQGTVAQLVKLLQGSDPDLQERALWALQAMGPAAERAIPSLVAAWKEGKASPKTVFPLLGQIGEGSVPVLIATLRHGDVEIRRDAALALIKCGDSAVPELRKLLDESQADAPGRTEAQTALRKIEQRSASMMASPVP